MDLALKLVVEFFRDKRYLLSTVVVPMQLGQSVLPLHLVNWVASKYAKEVPVRYWIDEQGKRSGTRPTGRAVFMDVWKSFQDHVDQFGREGFAPFRKQESRVLLEFEQPDVPPFETAVCQLSFFRWAWLYGVLDYCLEHLEELVVLFTKFKVQRRNRRQAQEQGQGQEDEPRRAPKRPRALTPSAATSLHAGPALAFS